MSSGADDVQANRCVECGAIARVVVDDRPLCHEHRRDVADGLVEACPNCDRSSRLIKRLGKRPDLEVEPGTYRCDECGERFDELVLRPPKNHGSTASVGRLSAAGRALLEMDPDDWPPKEGSE